MAESIENPTGESGERTIVRDMSFLGAPWGANACMVDVKGDKVIRIRPLRYFEQYTKEEVKPWVMRARGQTFEPGDKTLPPPFSIAYKKRVYSPARIRFPMKRVDFDPNGERNIQNRGTSKFERISWDEALDIIGSRRRTVPPPSFTRTTNTARTRPCMALTGVVANYFGSSGATRTRSATPIAGKAGIGGQSTPGAASISASRNRRRTSSGTSPRTPS